MKEKATEDTMSLKEKGNKRSSRGYKKKKEKKRKEERKKE